METGIFKSVHDALLPLSNGVGTAVGGLIAIGGLIYIGSKVWPALAKGEPIDFYPLLRPFIIGLFCMYFEMAVVTPIQYVLSPVKRYAELLAKKEKSAEKQSVVIRQLTNKLKDDRSKEMAIYNSLKRSTHRLNKPRPTIAPSDGMLLEDYDYAAMMKAYEANVAEFTAYKEKNPHLVEIDGVENTTKGGRIKKAILDAFGAAVLYVVDCAYSLMYFVFHLLRIVFLSILNILGPIALGISIFPGFQNNVVNWLSKYVSIYLWAPIVDLIIAIVYKASILICSLPEVTRNFSSTSLVWLAVIINIIGIAALLAVPTISSWIVQGGEDGRATKGFSTIGGAGAAYAGSLAGSQAGSAENKTKKGALSKIPFLKKFIK